MARSVVLMSGLIGVGLAIPIVGSFVPSGNLGKGSWAPLDAAEWQTLQTTTTKPVKISFLLKSKDAYLPEQVSHEYVWGIKVAPAKFQAVRPDLFVKGGPASVGYPPINLGFVLFSPICPHLGCRYNWDGPSNKFLCPCHGSVYTLLGEHIAGPAPRGLDPLPLKEQNGTAEVTWIHYETMTPDRIIISYQ